VGGGKQSNKDVNQSNKDSTAVGVGANINNTNQGTGNQSGGGKQSNKTNQSNKDKRSRK
jgi:hypothetical protein